MSTWPSLGARLLKIKCSRTKSQSRRSLLLICEEEQRLKQSFIKIIQEMREKNLPESMNPKEKAQWNTGWARLPKTKVST